MKGKISMMATLPQRIGEQNPFGKGVLIPQRKRKETTRTDLVLEFLVGLRFAFARLFGAQLSDFGFAPRWRGHLGHVCCEFDGAEFGEKSVPQFLSRSTSSDSPEQGESRRTHGWADS